jgi:replicative DNA helicase
MHEPEQRQPFPLSVQSRDAEFALCGSVIVDPDVLDAHGIEPGDFSNPRLAALWSHMGEIRRRGLAIDDVTLLEGAPLGVDLELVSDVALRGYSSNASHYARIVREHAIARRTLEAMADVDAKVRAGLIEGTEVLHTARSAIEHVAQRAHVDDTPSLATIDDVLDDLERSASLPSVSLGWPKLDDVLGGGIVAGQVAVVGGSTGAGKTAFAMQCAAHRAERGPVLVASYELPLRWLLARVAAQKLRLPWLSIAQGQVPRDELARVIPPNLHMSFRPSLHVLRRLAHDLAQREGEAPLIVVDYLQLVAHIQQAKTGQPDLRIATGQVSEALRDLASELDAPMLVISAVSRGGGTRLRTAREVPPADLVDVARECGSIEYDASAVIALSVADDEDSAGRVATVTVAKSRFGRAKHLDFRFDGAPGIWSEHGDVVTAKDEAIRDQIRASLRSAVGPLSARKIIERDKIKHVKGSTARVHAAIRAMVQSGEVIERDGAHQLAEIHP